MSYRVLKGYGCLSDQVSHWLTMFTGKDVAPLSGTEHSNSRYSACCPSLRLNKTLLRWLTASSRSNQGEIMPKMGVIGCRETALFVLQTHQAWDDQRSPGSPTDTPRIP